MTQQGWRRASDDEKHIDAVGLQSVNYSLDVVKSWRRSQHRATERVQAIHLRLDGRARTRRDTGEKSDDSMSERAAPPPRKRTSTDRGAAHERMSVRQPTAGDGLAHCL